MAATHQANDKHLAHHFATTSQQEGAAKLGMWIFLVTEVLFFGGLFLAYAVFRGLYPAELKRRQPWIAQARHQFVRRLFDLIRPWRGPRCR